MFGEKKKKRKGFAINSVGMSTDRHVVGMDGVERIGPIVQCPFEHIRFYEDLLKRSYMFLTM